MEGGSKLHSDSCCMAIRPKGGRGARSGCAMAALLAWRTEQDWYKPLGRASEGRASPYTIQG